MSGVQRARAESGRMSTELAAHARDNQQAWEQTGKALAGIGLAAGAGVALAITKYAAFDKQMSAVQAATLATAGEMEGLRAVAIKAGQDTAYSAQEAAGGIEELAKAGISSRDIIGGGLAGALDLAAAGSLDVATASEIAATAMVQFKLSGDQVSVVADALAAGANKAQGSVEDLGLALSYAGVPAAALDMSIEETTGVLGLFANAGIIGEKAGTALRAMLVSLQNPSEKAAGTMSDLGIEVFDAQGNFIGMEGVAGVLQDRMGNLDQKTRGAALATIFGNESLGAATTLYQGGSSAVATWTDAVSESGYAAEVAATRLDNLAGDVTILRGSLETAFIGLGQSGSGPLREVTQDLTTLVNEFTKLPEGMQSGVLAIGGLTAAVGLAGGAAFLALPKLVAANTALATMGPLGAKAAAGMSAVARAGGPISLALSGIAIVGGLALDSYIDQKQAVDSYVGSLDTLTGAVTDSTRAVATKTLEDEGALEAAKRLNISTADLVTAIVDGGPAYDEMTARLAAASDKSLALSEAQVATGGTATQASQDVYLLQGALESNSVALTDAQEKALRMAEAQDGVAASSGEAFREIALLGGGVETTGVLAAEAVAPTDALAASVEGVAEEAETAEEKLDRLSTALDALLGAELGVMEATDATENAIAELAARVEDADGKVVSLSGGITDNSQAARDNRAAINDAMEAVAAEAEARVRAGEDIATVTGRIYKSRDALIAEAIERGASREEAEAYTDVLLDIPGTVTSIIETPGMTRAKEDAAELAKILNAMPKNLKISTAVFTSEAKRDIATARRGAEGDAPGGFSGVAIGSGGKALARVKSSLPGGLRITSTYRSPARNRAVGGSPTSKHMDKNNPAVDIGGPTSSLDRYAEQLRKMGGWRQLLWRVAGHYDHIHVAHTGGEVSSSWRRQPGDRSDERTARLQVGERVLSRVQNASYEAGPARYGRPATFAGAGAAGAAGKTVSHTWRIDAGTAALDRFGQSIVTQAMAEVRVQEALEGWVNA